MYYGRYCRETRRLIKSWRLPSEIVTHPKIEPTNQIEGSSDKLPDDAAYDYRLNEANNLQFGII